MHRTLDDRRLEFVAVAVRRHPRRPRLIAILAIGTAVLLLELLVVSLRGSQDAQDSVLRAGY